MPPVAMHPQAKFDPIPPDLDLHSLVQDTPNFEWATQISASEIFALGQQRFERLVSIHVINGGKPLVIKDWNDRLPKGLFSAKWLEEVYNRKEERVWDINGKANIPMTMGHYLRSMKQLTDQWTPRNFRDERRQRLYLKDIDCPLEWQEKLAKVLPRLIFYLNQDIEGGHTTTNYGMTDDDQDMFVDDHPTARAGDLMSSLPNEMRAENLMCYIGHEGTYTPAHREMCASLGQNIMVEASGSDNGEKPGSSIWFMTETKDREVVGEYFLSMLGHDVEIEKHFAQINAWKKAAFPVYIVEQKVGDLILVPPLAPHQVWNRGTRTMKVAWNRTTVETLEMALHEALPKARLVCRDEQYKNKAIIYYTMKKYYKELEYAQTDRQLVSFGIGNDSVRNPVRTSQVADDFKKLMRLYTEILVDEMFNTKEKNVEYIPFDSNITCSYCRSNIFNRFLTCKHCVRPLANGDEDTYDVCMECYAMGRSCMCVSGLGWCEQWPWEELVSNYDRWQAMVVSNDGFIDAFSSPPPLEVARLRAGKKPVAQICQEQLRRRPFRDITKPLEKEKPDEPEEPEVDDNGKIVKKKPKSRSKKGDTYRCHVCCHKDHRYRLAFCTTPGCSEAYCYGVLYRGFDMMPQSVMQKDYWKCPRCMKICNCGACRRAGITNPYIPKATLLGHDTRPIADDRSVESLINFRLHNLLWLKNSGEEGRSIASKRMQRLRQEADAAKAQGVDGELDDGFNIQNGNGNGHGHGTSSQDHSMMDTSHADGFGDASHIGNPLHDMHGDNANINPSLLQDGSATSYPDLLGDYPDPNDSLLGSELAPTTFGRAYYMDDDDSPNKILFDPYHEPAPNPMVGNLGSLDTLPEFLESYTHKPIRKPRQEKDLDPDYTGPRKRNRKKSGAHNAATTNTAGVTATGEAADPNMNLDPALLGAQQPGANGAPGESGPSISAAPAAPTSSIEAAIATAVAAAARADDAVAAAAAAAATTGTGTGTGDAAANADSADKDAEGEKDDDNDNDDDDGPTYGYPANVPELRHARPKVSYLVDVASDNEADEEVTTSKKKEKPAVVNDSNVIPSVETEATEAATEVPSPAVVDRAAESVSKTPSAPTPAAASAAKPTTGPQTEPKKRGRPPRSSLPGGTTPSSEPAAKRSRIAAALAFSGKKAVEGFGSAWKPVNAPGPGRPPKRPSYADGSASDSEENEDNDDDYKASPAMQSAFPKRKPGRPPKSSLGPGPGRPSLRIDSEDDLSRPTTPSLPPPTTKFMSMAERMALKGKKFKIGKKKPEGDKAKEGEKSATPSANSPALDKPNDKNAASSTPKPGPTITRRPAMSSDEDSGDDVVEKARRPTAVPTRGTPSRGRDRPTRGRPPGSGRGKAGPTVVRLLSSDSESGSASGNDSGSDFGKKTPAKRRVSAAAISDDDDDSDDSDSAASTTRKPFFGRRGGGARGRGGRGRGRPRGRPPGISR